MGPKFLWAAQYFREDTMKGSPEEKKMEKKTYGKPELKRHGKLTDMVAGGISPNGSNDID